MATRKRKETSLNEPVSEDKGKNEKIYKTTEVRKNLTPSARRFVLKCIAEYKRYDWIAEQLELNYGFKRSPQSLQANYGGCAQYRDQIQKYRDKFNAGINDEPLASKRHVMQRLENAINQAEAAGDYKGASSLYKQLMAMQGFKAPENVEINHTITGGLSYEQKIKALTDNAQKPPAGLLPPPLPSAPDIIDVQAT